MVLAQYVRVIILLAGSKTVYSCMYKVGVCNSNEHINTEYVPYVLVSMTNANAYGTPRTVFPQLRIRGSTDKVQVKALEC